MSTFSNSEQQWSLLALLHKLRSGESASFEVGIQCSDSSGSSRNSQDTEQSQADGWLLICRHLQSQREDKERGSFAKDNRTRRDAFFLPSKLTKRKKSLKQTGHRAAVSRHSVFFPHSFFRFSPSYLGDTLWASLERESRIELVTGRGREREIWRQFKVSENEKSPKINKARQNGQNKWKRLKEWERMKKKRKMGENSKKWRKRTGRGNWLVLVKLLLLARE